MASRLATLLITLITMIVAYYLETVEGAWKILLALGAGTGLVYILRWYWWRINAWSEISAMAGALVVSLSLQQFSAFHTDDPYGFAYSMLITVGLTTIIWVAVTLVTSPEPDETLRAFYARVQPGGRGWRRIIEQMGNPPTRGLGDLFLNWILGCALIYLFLIGIGQIVFQLWLSGVVYIFLGFLAGAIIFWNLQRQDWESLREQPITTS
jgi:hypothetical protein